MRKIEFITSMNCDLEKFLSPNTTTPERDLLGLQETLPYEEPSKYGDFCNYEVKLMQIAVLSKHKCFGDVNIEKDWVTDKQSVEPFHSEQIEPFTVIT